MLPMVLALVLSQADAPAAAESSAPPSARFSARFFPVMPGSRVLENVGSTLARPFRPELTDLWLIVPAVVATVIALQTDVDTHRLIRQLPDPQIDGKGLSWWAGVMGEGWFDISILLAVGLIGGRDGQRACLAGLQALAAAAIASPVGKVVIRLERPSYDENGHHFFSRPQADAMPAGHAMSAFATATVLALEYPKLSPVFFLLATWVGVARIQQNAHWLSDVIVGAALGTLFGLQATKLTRRYEVEVQPWASSAGGGVTFARRF
jgi:undecaprenyl-diphosphatase